MTQVVPEHVARAKLGGSGNLNTRKDNNSTQKVRPQRSNSATLSTITVTCDVDTSSKSRHSRPELSPSKPSSIRFTTNNNIGTSHSASALTNLSILPPYSFNNHQQRQTSMSTSSDMNIVHEKGNNSASTSTMSIPNKHFIKTTTTTTTPTTTAAAAAAAIAGATSASAKALSIKHKSTSFDDHRSTRAIGKSVLEHLVFVFPENVRRILVGPKK